MCCWLFARFTGGSLYWCVADCLLDILMLACTDVLLIVFKVCWCLVVSMVIFARPQRRWRRWNTWELTTCACSLTFCHCMWLSSFSRITSTMTWRLVHWTRCSFHWPPTKTRHSNYCELHSTDYHHTLLQWSQSRGNRILSALLRWFVTV